MTGIWDTTAQLIYFLAHVSKQQRRKQYQVEAGIEYFKSFPLIWFITWLGKITIL